MSGCIGIRVEDKNEWERRTPLVPSHVKELIEASAIDVRVQSSPIRAFSAEEYTNAGARVVDTLCDCSVIVAVKEVPVTCLEKGKTYLFFSHTIKGQRDNMPMLQRILDLDCQLIDYEKIVDEDGRRLVFFGNYAGLAGMIDTLWALGQRLKWEEIDSPFSQLRQAHFYPALDEAKEAVRAVSRQIAQKGLPQAITPLICGFAGYGNVSLGAQEIFDLLPFRELRPEALESFHEQDPHHVFKVVFKEKDMVVPKVHDADFHLQEYYNHPGKYQSRFEDYVPHLTLLVNGIFWNEQYPRLVSRRFLRKLYSQNANPRLRVIGDISCDVEGSIECNVRTTSPGNPIYTYDPTTGQTSDGCRGRGPVVLAVDNLPCELPRESSTHFSRTLMPFVQEIADADYSMPFERCDLSPTIKRAVIVWRGKLTPRFEYLTQFL